MKTILLKTCFLTLFSFAFLFLSFNIKIDEFRTIQGLILDEKADPIAGVNIFLEKTKKGTISNLDGQFELRIPKEVKTLSFYTYGFETYELKLDVREFYEILLVKSDISTITNADLYDEASSDYKKSTKYKREMLWCATEPSPPKVKSSYTSVNGEPKMAEEVLEVDFTGMSEPESSSSDTYSRKERSDKKSMSAGQLTAGEWNDLNNWEDWQKLVEEKDYKEMGEYWSINAKNRISVFVSNQYELPISDCEVELRTNKSVLWSAKTDNAGKAELWVDKNTKDTKLVIRSKSHKKEIEKVLTIDKGVNRVRFEEECSATPIAEVMFVVDATGSMGDEIEFLKSELNDVIENVESTRSSVEFRWGSVFYRDATDEYLTRQSPLNNDKDKVVNFIKMQGAGGGGDYPEAVNEGLEEALLQDWSTDAIARIIFLVLDAPPHHNPEILNDLKSQIELAASLGIKIIPVTASGINRQTEYLMKFMSIMTNGTYVFLTDHSGIGNSHLAPVTKDYEVEKLNDLLNRLIKNYSDPGRCAEQNLEDPIFANIEIFPNPAIDLVQIKVPEGVDKVSITSNSGQIVYKEAISHPCNVNLNISSYVDGMYIINMHTNKKIYSYKLIKSGKV